MPEATETLTIPAEGMRCGHCQAAVRQAPEGVPGVESARVGVGDRAAARPGTEAGAIGKEGALEGIVRLVRDARSSKAGVQRPADAVKAHAREAPGLVRRLGFEVYLLTDDRGRGRGCS